MRIRRAFTIIELITVMAITAILLTIISVPLVQGYNLSKIGQGFAEAQDRARRVMDRVSRDISNAASVRDNSSFRGEISIYMPGANGAWERILLPYSKMDAMMPSAGEPLRGPGGALLNPNLLKDPNGDPNDPNNWKEDPTLRTPVGQPVFPTASGAKIVRYFVGLRHPLAVDGLGKLKLDGSNNPIPGTYNNPYDAMFGRFGSGEDNLYVLYRAEADYKRWRPNGAGGGQWVYNDELFEIRNGRPVLDDPDFFTLSPNAADFPQNGTPQWLAKVNRIKAWQRIARNISNFSRIDLIQPDYDKRTFKVNYNGNVPRILPALQFRPERVTNEPAEGSVVARTNEEFEGSNKVGSDVLRSQYGGWVNAYVRLWPSVPQPNRPWDVNTPWQSGLPYAIGRQWAFDAANRDYHVSIFDVANPAAEYSGGTETFDITEYLTAKDLDPATLANNDLRRYPFTNAMMAANSRSGWMTDGNLRARFVPFATSTRLGQVSTSFSIEEVGGQGSVNLAAGQDNRPVLATGTQQTWSQYAAAGGTTDWKAANVAPSSPTSTVNDRFNCLFNIWNTVAPGLGKSNLRRFVDLRFVPCADGTPSPLDPRQGFYRVKITPGSEVVIGPDQLDTSATPRYVRYTRVVATGQNAVSVGPNQYFINYTQRADADPNLYQDLGYTVSTDPLWYDENNFASAILQPRYRVGYLELYSDPNIALPSGNIFVSYRFQFSESADVVAVDYDSRQVIDLSLTIRQYPGVATAPNAQTVTLNGRASVRNFIR
ncbi:MAG: prepilin-type N-terminal cleavage/methylation domain-containing protein [Armatimonadetes bacterium]|nr:prepilin-type N-terminal cleavage/methylation domain-containing protein [Armatimonadota bacterium]